MHLAPLLSSPPGLVQGKLLPPASTWYARDATELELVVLEGDRTVAIQEGELGPIRHYVLSTKSGGWSSHLFTVVVVERVKGGVYGLSLSKNFYKMLTVKGKFSFLIKESLVGGEGCPHKWMYAFTPYPVGIYI